MLGLVPGGPSAPPFFNYASLAISNSAATTKHTYHTSPYFAITTVFNSLPCLHRSLQLSSERSDQITPVIQQSIMARVVQGGHQLRLKPTASSKQKKITASLKRTDSREAAASSLKPSPDAGSLPRQVPLLALPLELRKTIVEYIPRNTDRCNICLTCKELRELVLPYLYRHMVLSPRKLCGDKHALFIATHPGLQHIRTFRIIPLNGCFSSAGHLPGVCRLLHAMPKDGLQTFEYIVQCRSKGTHPRLTRP